MTLMNAVYIYYLASAPGAAAAKAAAGKVGKHRDLVLAGNPDNRFVPFAVEEGGRLGTDAEALVDVMVRAGSADPTTWCLRLRWWARNRPDGSQWTAARRSAS